MVDMFKYTEEKKTKQYFVKVQLQLLIQESTSSYCSSLSLRYQMLQVLD